MGLGVAMTTALITVMPIQPVFASHYYDGYDYKGSCCAYTNGVFGSIATINPNILTFDWFQQWVENALSYSPDYWIQTGYIKCGSQSWCATAGATTDTYYCEGNVGTPLTGFFNNPGPSPGTSQSYETYYEGGGYWACWNGSGDYTEYDLGNTQSIDMQAKTETTNTCIAIGGTHFSALQYEDTGSIWHFWDVSPYGYSDSPYVLNYVSNSEFTSSGGTGC